jgi:hypothetical protein
MVAKDGPPAKKARRSSNKRQRTKLTAQRWLAEEFSAVAAKADNAGLSFGAYIRATVLGDPGPRAQRRPPADHRTLRKILGEIGRVSNNVNQIAHALHIDERTRLPELPEALKAITDIRRAILEALGKDPGHDNKRR